MDKFIVRPAARRESFSIRSLIKNVHINPFGLDWRRFLVAETVSYELIGCGQIKTHADGSKELASIAVQENFRGYGVASDIIIRLLERESARPIFLMCRARLESFYTRFGFQTVMLGNMSLYFQFIIKITRPFFTRVRLEDQLLVMRLD